MATVQRKLVHKQFNSPIGLYSEDNVKDTLNRELRAFSNGTAGIETTDQHRTVNLANSAVLKMLEEQEGERMSVTKGRQSRPRDRLTIDRETVLKINRRPRRRDLSWPPQQNNDWSRSRSNSTEMHFDESIRKGHQTSHSGKMFDAGAIEKNKTGIPRTLSSEIVQRMSQDSTNQREERSSLTEIRSRKIHREWPPQLPSNIKENIESKMFHLPEDELHIGLIEPIKEYFERVADSPLPQTHSIASSSLKQWGSYDNIPQTLNTGGKHTIAKLEKITNINSSLVRYKSNSYSELPPPKPFTKSNKKSFPTVEKLNLNYSGNVLEIKDENEVEKSSAKLRAVGESGTTWTGQKRPAKVIRFKNGWTRERCHPTDGELQASGVNCDAKNTQSRNEGIIANFSTDHELSSDVNFSVKNKPYTTKESRSGSNDSRFSNVEEALSECIKLSSSHEIGQKNRIVGHQPQMSGRRNNGDKIEHQGNYDLASEVEQRAKNNRAHNLPAERNGHVNIISNECNGGRKDVAAITRPAQSGAIKANDSKKDHPPIMSLPASSGKVNEMGNRNDEDDPQKSPQIYDKAHVCHPMDFVDGSNPGTHKPKRDENLQECSGTEQENITRVGWRSQRRLKDNDGYMGKYCQKEISKSDLSPSFSTPISEKKDRRRGMYFTDGEYIWGPFETPSFEQNFIVDSRSDYKISETGRRSAPLLTNNGGVQNPTKMDSEFHKYPLSEFCSTHPKGFQDTVEIIDNKLSHIQKSIAEDIRRINEYMAATERTLQEAEKDLIETPISKPACALDKAIESTTTRIVKNIPLENRVETESLHWSDESNSVSTQLENMPSTKHALVDLYKLSKALDKLSDLISTTSAEGTRITEIDDGQDEFSLNTVSPFSGPESDSTSGTEAGSSTDKIIQSKNILSGYLITKQDQEHVLLKAGISNCIPIPAENENGNVIVDLVNGKSCCCRKGTDGSNDPLKIDEKSSEILNNDGHLLTKSDSHGNTEQFYGAEKLSHHRQLNSCRNQPKLSSSDDVAQSKPRVSAINKDNKLKLNQEANVAPSTIVREQSRPRRPNETIHKHELHSEHDARTADANPNMVSPMGIKEQQRLQLGNYQRPQNRNSVLHSADIRASVSGADRVVDGRCHLNPAHEKLDACGSLSIADNPKSDFGSYCGEQSRNKPSAARLTRNDNYLDYAFRSSSQPSFSPPCTKPPPNAGHFHTQESKLYLIRQSSFDNSDSRYFGAPNLYFTGHFCPTEGYKRVAWPPASEDTPVKGSTPQPQHPQHQGGQNYYSQPTQPQYPQQYGGQSPQHQQPAQYYQQQHHQPRQESQFHQQPTYPQEDLYAQRGSYGRHTSNPSQERQFHPTSPQPSGKSSTVAFSGGVAQKHLPSLPGQPQYPPPEDHAYSASPYGPHVPQGTAFQQPIDPQHQCNFETRHNPQTQSSPQSQYNPQSQFSPQPQYNSQSQYNPQPQYNTQQRYSSQPQYGAQREHIHQPQYESSSPYDNQPQYNTQPPSHVKHSAEPVSEMSPRGWSHVRSPAPARAGYTQGSSQYPSTVSQPPFGFEPHFGGNQPQVQQSYQAPASHPPSYGQPQAAPQQYTHPEHQYYPQGQPQYQFDRGQSPGVIQLRKEVPISQKPSPVVTSQPAAKQFRGGSNMRGDLKWPPPEVKAQMDAEEEQRHKLALGPACRPRRVNKDYSKFFAQHALNATYPGYKIPPGTQHVYVEF